MRRPPVIFEALEPRLLLDAAYPTGYEQYMLELVNRARADPAAEVGRVGAGYWDGAADLNEGLDAGTISSDAKQPLAFDTYLIDGARDHSQWMIDNDTFSHTGQGGTDAGDRMANAGYTFDPPAWSWAENIAWQGTTGTYDVVEYVWELEAALFGDKGIDGRGHRINLMNPDFREVGVGVVEGVFTDGGTDYNSVMATQNFAYSGEGVFLTGVAYDDDNGDDDDFYSPGEGIGSATVTAVRHSDGAGSNTTTWASGGYTLELAAGTYDVTASGAGLGAVVVHSLTIGTENVKQDFTPGENETLAFDQDTPAVFVDSDGDVVTLRLQGEGSGTVAFEAAEQTAMSSIVLNGTTATSSLTITVSGSGGGLTTVGDLTVNGSMRRIIGADVDLLGDVDVTGSLDHLVLHDVADQHTISIGPSADGRAALTIELNDVQDLGIDSDIPIWWLDAAEWLDTDATADVVEAPWLYRLTVAGDFEADLELDGTDAPGDTLHSAVVDGCVDGDWNIGGDVGRIRVGEWTGGSLTAETVLWLRTTTAGGESGDFAADVALAGGAGTWTLTGCEIAGTLDGAAWGVAGDAGRIRVGTWGAGSTLKAGLDADPAGEFFTGDYDADEGRVERLTISQHDVADDGLFGVIAREFGRATLDGAPVLADDLHVADGEFMIVRSCPQQAVSLPLWDENVDLANLAATLDDLVALGVNRVAVNVFWFQDNINSTVIAPDFALHCASDASVRAVIDAILARGMKVTLKPLVDLSDDAGHWRGEIVGSEEWFTGAQGYAVFINHFADIAEEKDVDVFCVGTELVATANEEARWRAVIAGVRARYSGKLVYAANHGGSQATEASIAWWDALDYIGIDAYYPLTGKNDPTPDELKTAWAARASTVQSWLAGLDTADQKPVIFAEVGYRSWEGTNQAPGSQTDQSDNNVDEQEQADCYTALFEQLWKQKSWLQGTYWWNWEVDPDPTWEADNWFTPQNKLAETVLGDYYGS